jgi:uncharacterized membrane protein YbhN (UPF0104 family)
MAAFRGHWQVLFKALASLLATGYVGWELYSRRDELASLWSDGWGFGTSMLVMASVLLMPLNYALEAEKWRVVVRPFYPQLKLQKAMVAVFAGMASGIWTPNRVGEYAGRVVFLKEGSRFEAIIATFVDRVCQLLVTLLCGLLALAGLVSEFGSGILEDLVGSPKAQVLFVVFAAAMGVAVFIFLAAPRHFSGWIPTKWNSAAWIRKLRFALSHLPWPQILRVFLLSALRYGVFSSQYLLLMYAFGYTGSAFLGYGIIALVFMGKSVLPVMGIFELGVREWVAVMVMGVFGQASPMAVSSTLLLYLVNILLPTLIGVVALQRLKEE